MTLNDLYQRIEEALDSEPAIDFELRRNTDEGWEVIEASVQPNTIQAKRSYEIITKTYPATRYEPEDYDTRYVEGDSFTGQGLVEFKAFVGDKADWEIQVW